MRTTQLRNGAIITVGREDRIAMTPIVPLLARAWVELLDAGLVDHSIPIMWDHPAVYAMDQSGSVVSAITYQESDWKRTCWIQLAVTHPDNRRLGLYTELYSELRTIGFEKGWREIAGGTSMRNDAMSCAARSVDRDFDWAIYVKKFPWVPK